MKTIILLLSIGCLTLCSLCGQNIVLRHTYYTSVFSVEKHIPVLVEYVLTKQMLTCGRKLKRTDHFAPDPQLPAETNLAKDYKGSGFDRGHNMSAEDNSCSDTGMSECFYYSNMFPQAHSLNAGKWKKLEEMERKQAKAFDSVKVFIGSMGKMGAIGEDSVVVPQFCWKVIYQYHTGEYECYIFPNEKPQNEFESYRVTLDELQHQGGVVFHKDRAEVY